MQRNEILRSYGTDYKQMTKELLEEGKAAEDIRISCGLALAKPNESSYMPDAEAAASLANASGLEADASAVSRKLHIGIKPNLVCPTPAEFGGTTHPEIAAGIIEYLTEHGFGADEIEILEGSWVGDKTEDAFEYCGYNALSREYGVRLKDMQKERDTVSCDCKGLKLDICKHAADLDYIINVPVLKGHCQTKITCALKNMKGLIPNAEKRRFHSLGLHKPIAHLNTVLKPGLIVIDHICGDPDFEEGGSPLVRNCVMLAKDPVLVDAFTAKLLGYETEEVKYIILAEQLGIGCTMLNKAVIRTISGEPTEGEPGDNYFNGACTVANDKGTDFPCDAPETVPGDTALKGHGTGGAGNTVQQSAGAPCPAAKGNDLKTPETRKIVEISCAVDEIDSCSACFGSLIPALDRLKQEGSFDKLLGVLNGNKLGIGQGYRGRNGCYGVGNCTSGFNYCIKGCPPKTEDIYKSLKELID